MSSEIELIEVVDVQITRETPSITRDGFGTLLIIQKDFQSTASGTDIVKTYGSLDEVLDDGFTSGTEVYKCAAAYFGQALRPSVLKIGQYTQASPVASIEAIRAVDDNWYGLYAADDMTTDYQDRMLDIAEYIETTRKLFAAKTLEADTIDTTVGADSTTLAAQLRTLGRTRTWMLWAETSQAAAQWRQAAWFGLMLSMDPGAASWANKTLSGVAPAAVAAAPLTTTQRTNLFDKNVNLYSNVGGRNITREGKVASGEWIDVMVGIDWLVQQITAAVYRVLYLAPKVPYTDEGIAMIENAVRGILLTAQDDRRKIIAPDITDDDGVITPGFTITVPRIQNTDPADRAARLLQGVRFEARLAGGIHTLIIRGVVAP